MMVIAGYVCLLVLQKGVFVVEDDHGLFDDDDDVDGDKKDGDDEKAGESPATDAEPMSVVSPATSDTNDKEGAGDKAADDEKEAAKHRMNLVVFFTAFCIHGFVEGVALGFQDNSASVLSVFIAIIAHHWAHDFLFAHATGKVLGLKDSPVLRFLISAPPSLSTSLGIGIGWAVGNSVPTVVTGFVVGFSAGTFVYIGLTDMVPEDMPKGKRSGWQILAFLVGMGGMYGLLAGLYSPEAHNH
jgi:zinc transporter ZupT